MTRQTFIEIARKFHSAGLNSFEEKNNWLRLNAGMSYSTFYRKKKAFELKTTSTVEVVVE